jgi:hypothetical protein
LKFGQSKYYTRKKEWKYKQETPTAYSHTMSAILRAILDRLPISLSMEQIRIRRSLRIIRKVCNSRSNVVMAGCHSIYFVNKIVGHLRKGHLFAIESDALIYKNLLKKYADQPLIHLFPSPPDQISIATALQKNIPGYIDIDVIYLSENIDPDTILSKCERLLDRERVYLIFTLRPADETIHRKIFHTLTADYGMHLFTCRKWLRGKHPLDEHTFLKLIKKRNFHLLAYRKKISEDLD